ncbi:MAG: TetR/AcrR family transcriptional regulator [Pseudomonadales bacterium]|nr:TetR/AcrR family transcriptional regulator [Pseudomonadales bacterium]
MGTRDTQQRIIDCAIELFNELGVKAVSLKRVAESLGISAGNLHYHFRTKEDVVLAIFDRIRNDSSQVSADDLQTPTVAHMHFMFERYASLVWRYRFFFRELSALTDAIPSVRRRYFENRREHMASLEQFFEKLIEVGVMRRPTPPTTVATLVTLSWMVSDNWLFYQDADSDGKHKELVERGFDLVMAIFQPYLCS